MHRFTQTLTSVRLLHGADTANGCLVARTFSSTSKRTETHMRREKTYMRAATGILCLEGGCFSAERRLRRVKRKLPILGTTHRENSLNPNTQRPSLQHPTTAHRPTNKAEAERLLCYLTFIYHGCPYFFLELASPWNFLVNSRNFFLVASMFKFVAHHSREMGTITSLSPRCRIKMPTSMNPAT